ncbi:hypothetical protein ABT150_14175 [Streptomyces mirabilis]
MYAGLLPGLAVASLGLRVVFVTATTTALAMVAHQEAGLASGVVNTFHEVGGSIGAAVLSTVASAGAEHGAIDGFTDAFTLSAVAAAVSAGVALFLVPPGRPQMTALITLTGLARFAVRLGRASKGGNRGRLTCPASTAVTAAKAGRDRSGRPTAAEGARNGQRVPRIRAGRGCSGVA